MKTIKYIVLVGLTFALAVSLVAGACAPAAPTGDEGAAEIAALEDDLADEKAKVKSLEGDIDDLEDDIAALKKPAKVYRWEPAVWINAGTPWDFLVYFSEYVNAASDGRIVSTPSSVGAVAPAEELMEAVSDGTTGAMLPTPSYYAGKFPLAAVYNSSIGLPSWVHQLNCFEVFQDGRAFELYQQEAEKLYNVEVVGERIGPMNIIMSSTVLIDNIYALEGVKFRCGDEHIVAALDAFGSATVWAPGSEIYTMLATGVVDAFTYGSAYDHYGMSFHEVTTHWLRTPSLMASANEQFVVNRDVWNEMPDDLKTMVTTALVAANGRSATEGEYLIASAWADVEAYGIILVDWPAGDEALWIAAQVEWAQQFAGDPAVAEFLQIVNDYGEFMGYL